MKFLNLLSLASAASAHTLFTTLYIDDENQGDGTCVRQPSDGKTANSPIYPLNGDAMACGENGNTPVKYSCPAPSGAKLTFQFRMSPSYSEPGAIAEGHKGPCNVYVKKVSDMQNASAAGDGWFKIWEDGYNEENGEWCTDRLIKNGGLLSVNMPTGLPSGYYLFRPEVLALHSALNGDPQFYTSCAQVFVEDGPETELVIPDKYEVSIPGYLDGSEPGLSFNIYETPMKSYPIPGPDVYVPASSNIGKKQTQASGVVPSDCLAKNANWCGKPIGKYSGQDACWAATDACWKQGEKCWDSAPPSGGAGCKTWGDYCTELGDSCKAGDFEGPPRFTGKEIFAESPGPCPSPYATFDTTDVTEDGSKPESNSSESVYEPPKTSSTVKPPKTTKIEVPTTVETDSGESGNDNEPEEATKTTSVYDNPATTIYRQLPTKTAYPDDYPGIKISEDGRCGGETKQTCVGSKYGDCCSRGGRCGRKTKHCGCGCQNPFGLCGLSSK